MWRKSFCLEAPTQTGLTTSVMTNTTPSTPFDSLAAYPPWFVAVCVTIVVAGLLWLMAKLLKWSLYFLMGLVLIGGAVATVWLIFK